MANQQFDTLKEGIDSLVNEATKPEPQPKKYVFNDFNDDQQKAYDKLKDGIKSDWRSYKLDNLDVHEKDIPYIYDNLKNYDFKKNYNEKNKDEIDEQIKKMEWIKNTYGKYLPNNEKDVLGNYKIPSETHYQDDEGFESTYNMLEKKGAFSIPKKPYNERIRNLNENDQKKFPFRNDFENLENAKKYYKDFLDYYETRKKENIENNPKLARRFFETEYDASPTWKAALNFMKNNIDEYFNDDNNDELYDDTYDEYGGGYSGHSMSNRAVNAYEHGLAPLSRWDRDRMLSVIDDYSLDSLYPLIPLLEKLSTNEIRKNLLEPVSWHHTGKFYNPTTFYGLKKPKEIVQYLLQKYGMEK